MSSYNLSRCLIAGRTELSSHSSRSWRVALSVIERSYWLQASRLLQSRLAGKLEAMRTDVRDRTPGHDGNLRIACSRTFVRCKAMRPCREQGWLKRREIDSEGRSQLRPPWWISGLIHGYQGRWTTMTQLLTLQQLLQQRVHIGRMPESESSEHRKHTCSCYATQ